MKIKRFYNYASTSFQFFDDDDLKFEIFSWVADGRTGFQHRANVYFGGSFERYKNKFYKVQYYNRTWECFQYQTLLLHVLNDLLKDEKITREEFQELKDKIHKGNFEMNTFS